jgi:hypothetical protein
MGVSFSLAALASLATYITHGTARIDRGSFVTVAAHARCHGSSPNRLSDRSTWFNELRPPKKNPSEEGFERVATWDARADFRQFAAKQ